MADDGVLSKIRRLYQSKNVESLQPRSRAAVQDAATVEPCRPTAAVASSTMQAGDLAGWLDGLDLPARLQALRLAWCSLRATCSRSDEATFAWTVPPAPRPAAARHIRIVLHLDSALTELTYVFDEPAAGLHPHDTARVIELLHRLRDKGNNVLVVEHQPDVIRAADHIIDLGPKAGAHGGRVVFHGTPKQLTRARTLTAEYLNRRQQIKTRAPSRRHTPGGGPPATTYAASVSTCRSAAWTPSPGSPVPGKRRC